MTKKYRPALPDDRKKRGDQLNLGMWQHESKDRWVNSSKQNGTMFAPWEKYYRVLITEENHE